MTPLMAIQIMDVIYGRGVEELKEKLDGFQNEIEVFEDDYTSYGNGSETPPEEIASDKMVVSQDPDTGDVNIKKIIDDIEITEINIKNKGKHR